MSRTKPKIEMFRSWFDLECHAITSDIIFPFQQHNYSFNLNLFALLHFFFFKTQFQYLGMICHESKNKAIIVSSLIEGFIMREIS